MFWWIFKNWLLVYIVNLYLFVLIKQKIFYIKFNTFHIFSVFVPVIQNNIQNVKQAVICHISCTFCEGGTKLTILTTEYSQWKYQRYSTHFTPKVQLFEKRSRRFWPTCQTIPVLCKKYEPQRKKKMPNPKSIAVWGRASTRTYILVWSLCSMLLVVAWNCDLRSTWPRKPSHHMPNFQCPNILLTKYSFNYFVFFCHPLLPF